MIKKGLLISILLLLISNCAGTIKIADEDSTTPENRVAKPMQ